MSLPLVEVLILTRAPYAFFLGVGATSIATAWVRPEARMLWRLVRLPASVEKKAVSCLEPTLKALFFLITDQIRSLILLKP